MVVCAKCKQVAPQGSDTWCLACAGWEAIGLELGAPWPNPGLRQLAEDTVVRSADCAWSAHIGIEPQER